MAKKKKTTGKVPQKAPMRSNCAKAKKIIREDMLEYFNPKERGSRARSALDVMKIEAEGACDNREINYSNRYKGAKLVQIGDLACSYYDQAVMLKKIYGNKVDNWDGEKIHNTYKNLVGREYAAMLNEREKAKAKKAEERAKRKAQKKGGRK